MASLNYSDIFSGFYRKAEAYDLIDVPSLQGEELMKGWLHSAVNTSFIRRLFASLTIDDDTEEMVFELSSPTTDDADTGFVSELLSTALVIQWLEPKINSTLNVLQVFGSNEEKYYSQSNHLAQLQDLSKSLKNEVRQAIADRTITTNSYLAEGV